MHSGNEVDIGVAFREITYSPSTSHKCDFFFNAIITMSGFNPKLVVNVLKSKSRVIARAIVMKSIPKIFVRLASLKNPSLINSLFDKISNLEAFDGGRTPISSPQQREEELVDSKMYIDIDQTLETLMSFYDMEFDTDIEDTFIVSRPGTPGSVVSIRQRSNSFDST